MEDQAQLNGGGWRLMATRIRALAPGLAEGVGPAAKQARRLFPNVRFWTWPYAILPVAVAISMLIVAKHHITWWQVVVEVIAAVCALAGWGILRAYAPQKSGNVTLGLGGALLLVALIGGGVLARSATLIIPLGIVTLALMALSIVPNVTHIRIPAVVMTLAKVIVAPALLGVGLFAVTAQIQGARMTLAMWLLGGAMSLLACAAALARVMAGATSVEQGEKVWLRIWPVVAIAFLAADALIVMVALPRGAPHGLLLALLALPTALVAISGLARSTFVPARAWAARRIGALYTVVGLALTIGALASFAVSVAVDTLTKSLGF